MLFRFEFQSMFRDVNVPTPDGHTYVEDTDIESALELFKEHLGPSNSFLIKKIEMIYEHPVHRRLYDGVQIKDAEHGL